ncbi:MAG TPA: HK97 family phage prohead protease [Smithellaceae bacterium]|nr:HK97 family phage prohead protease [Smithellaceae bacterium]
MKEKRKTIEVRSIEADGGGLKKIVGYAAVFDKPSEDMGFIEYVRKGAFKKALARSDARALFNHDTDTLPLGRQSAGTLLLREDDTGLYYEINPPDTQSARDLMTAIDRGDIREASYGFTVDVDEWDYSDPDVIKRTIIEVREVYDISPVVFAAFNDTTVALRKLEENRKNAPPGDGEAGGGSEGSAAANTVLLEEEDNLYKKIMGF